ncbi:uncharacterized protein LOC126894914 isoform X3 [Daktulosphaira vitifoliae]|uniref:uncharacterized protein LOC126894914 isoform X3 n=1 Tax=Daktulosphaira vitifoliae TaxID=58002 RepID=UPI0021AAEEA1|nr:uncharacterized protein LOC126894914 isoform X3 [Daktulosphaira vitifoliae]
MFSKSIILLCMSYLIKLILSNEEVTYLTSVKMDNRIKMNYYVTKLNFQFKFNPVDEEWKKNKCENLGFTFTNHKPFVSAFIQTYKCQDFYKLLSDLICGDRKFSMKLRKKICNSIKTNDDIKKLFRDEVSFNDYFNHYITFINPVSLNYKAFLDAAEECPICFEKPDVLVILNECHHCLCKKCADTLLIRNENKCPLCRKYFSNYADKVEVSPCNKYGDNKCPLCCEKSDLPVILNMCHHSLCYGCAESLQNKNKIDCPLCGQYIFYYTDRVEGNVISSCSLVEYFAAAYYLDICIFLYIKENEWMFFDKNGLNYSEEDMDGKKCIYLFLNKYNKTIGVVVETEELSNFRDNLY